ncbi:uncharacterized protein [Aegilops tauschii subsp. strangulata]|uniref:uncharacterized protein n=1 Tax=Aegilops tauschii subsp. strangulata TaxID=200361 RepID=UPI000842836F|nr:uncharacterized protein LOC109760532 [Aegilops tauschii subsp. strangulata]XP_044439026.1 uncharacterized protein LOC123165448 [Triticum aestivum]
MWIRRESRSKIDAGEVQQLYGATEKIHPGVDAQPEGEDCDDHKKKGQVFYPSDRPTEQLFYQASKCSEETTTTGFSQPKHILSDVNAAATGIGDGDEALF